MSSNNDTTGLEGYPPSFRTIARVIGHEAAALLHQKLGGTRVYVPKVPRSGNRLVGAIGAQATALLCATFSSEILTLAKATSARCARRNVKIIGQYQAGISVRVLGLEHALTERQVYSILGGYFPGPPSQDKQQDKQPISQKDVDVFSPAK